MELYVIRHGETYANLKHLVNGRKESKLTFKGKIEAIKVKFKLKKIKFNVVISSLLKRAVATAKIIRKPIIIDERLIERSYRDFEGMKKSEFNYKGYWNFEENLSDHNVESISDLMDRTKKIINDLKDKYGNKRVLLVTHSGLARAIHYYLSGIPLDNDLTALTIPNCYIRKYRV